MSITAGLAILMGLPMTYWATTNIIQSKWIGEQRQDQLSYQYSQLDVRRAELEQQILEFQHNLQYGGTSSDYYALQEAEFEYRKINDLLNRQHETEQTHLIGAYDTYQSLLGEETRARISSSQNFTDTSIFEAKERQLESDANDFLLDEAFKASSDTSIFGEPESMAQVAYILRELRKLDTNNRVRPILPTLEHDSYLPSLDEEYTEFTPTNKLIY